MIYGIVPFIGTNILDLIRNVTKFDLKLKTEINQISKSTEKLLRLLLTSTPEERVSHEMLYVYPLNLNPKNEERIIMEGDLPKK